MSVFRTESPRSRRNVRAARPFIQSIQARTSFGLRTTSAAIGRQRGAEARTGGTPSFALCRLPPPPASCRLANAGKHKTPS
jgi:hypothetical protein